MKSKISRLFNQRLADAENYLHEASRLAKEVTAPYLSHTDHVIFVPGFQGQCVEDNIIYIGDRAGPQWDVSNLLHEMCHLVEIDDKRMIRDAWGLKVREIWVYDRMCIEPNTMQMTERELRVIAYQLNLSRSLNVAVEVEELVSPLKYMADSTYVPIEDGTSAYGEDRSHSLDYVQIQESQIRWMANRVSELSREYTLEKFNSEWNRKMKVLSQLPSTNEESRVA